MATGREEGLMNGRCRDEGWGRERRKLRLALEVTDETLGIVIKGLQRKQGLTTSRYGSWRHTDNWTNKERDREKNG